MISFNSLVQILLDKPYERSPCSGTHKVYTLCVIHNIDRRYGILSADNRELVGAEVDSIIGMLSTTQRACGAWDLDWRGGKKVPTISERGHKSEFGDRLRVSSHLLEAMAYLPAEHRVSSESMSMCIKYLTQALEDDLAYSDFLPVSTHALRALLLLTL